MLKNNVKLFSQLFVAQSRGIDLDMKISLVLPSLAKDGDLLEQEQNRRYYHV